MSDPAGHLRAFDRRGDPRAGAVGCLAFFGCLALGLVATNAIADYAVRDLPTGEVFEAVYRSEVHIRWWCGGAFVSLILSAAAGVWSAGRVVRKPAESDSDTNRP